MNETAKNKDEFVWTDELVKEFGRQWAAGILPDENPIEQFKASKQRKPLFTTEDGKQIFKEDIYFLVDTSWLLDRLMAHGNHGIYEGKRFSTEAAAIEYVRLNKPMYSFNDIGDAWEKLCHEAFTYDQLITELEKLKQ